MTSTPAPAGTQQGIQNPLRQVAANIYQLRQPLPFALNHVNCYLLHDEDGWTILDAGLNRPELRKRWQEAWRELSIDPHPSIASCSPTCTPILRPAGWLQQQTGAQVLLSPREIDIAR